MKGQGGEHISGFSWFYLVLFGFIWFCFGWQSLRFVCLKMLWLENVTLTLSSTNDSLHTVGLEKFRRETNCRQTSTNEVRILAANLVETCKGNPRQKRKQQGDGLDDDTNTVELKDLRSKVENGIDLGPRHLFSWTPTDFSVSAV